MPDPTPIIDAAGKQGWEPMMVAFVLIACIAAITWLVKAYMDQANKRELSMTSRIEALAEYQRTTLSSMLEKTQTVLEHNSTAIAGLRDTLEGKPCLLSDERSDWIVDRIAARVKDQVHA